ncbi:MAG: hypothetical protein ABIJ04_08455 [Bacteroidota bacterium]
MKNHFLLLLVLPVMLQAQDDNVPYIRFDQGSMLYYLPSQSAYALLLPASKPGFVRILRTPGFQTRSNQEISDQLASGIRDQISQNMTSAQKTEFLEQYACLILLNYTRVSELDTLFYTKAVSLQEDVNQEVKENASLVVKMADLYRKQ